MAAHHRRCHARRSCHAPTKPKMTHTLSKRYFAPPRGTYMYRTSHRLNEACQPRQKPRMVQLLLTHRSMFSGGSTPESSDHSRKKRQMTVNFSHMKLSTISDVDATSNGPNAGADDVPPLGLHARNFDIALAYCVCVHTSKINNTRPNFHAA